MASAPFAACGGAAEIELAWHLLTVLVRLGRPATPSDLTAASAASGNGVSPSFVERLCGVPGSPLRLTGGVVTASETAVVAFLRFAGFGVPAPRAGVRAPDESTAVRWWGRKKTPLMYERKRRKKTKAPDAGRVGVKRRLLMAPDADLVEQKQKQSQQLVAQICAPVATGEVHHPEVMQEFHDRLPTIGTSFAEHSFNFSSGVSVSPSVEISLPYLQPKIDQFLGGNNRSTLGGMHSALLTKELPNIPGCINISSLCGEKSGNIHATDDNGTTKIGEPEGALPFYNYRVVDSDDLEKESILLTIESALVKENKNGIEGDLNLICTGPSIPKDCNMKAADNIETIDVIPDRAEPLQYFCPNDRYSEKIPTCVQEKNAAENFLQSPQDTKVDSVRLEEIHEMLESLCQPSLETKVEHAVLPLELATYDCINNKNLNIVAKNREIRYLNHGEPSRNEVGVKLSKKEQDRRIMKQREKYKKNDILPKDVKDQLAAKVQKGQAEPKPLPSFKDFSVEEEEGSGGYGTVYRARRKLDKKAFAIKCPHTNAHPHHVSNELKMLERFGGRDCVIKFECSLRSGDLDCFVLQHVEHDRPENLKKEIDISDLQYYGHCLFTALASLHRQGIVHRDVKPGNFLFSRKMRKGYLIDFNLANDLHQKFLRNGKSEAISCGKDTISQPALKSALVVHSKEPVVDSKETLGSKRKRSNKSPVDSMPKIDYKSRHGTQAADVSGVTSAKDPTSAKTSLDRLKQPMPYKGRKELMNFLHEAMQSPNKDTPAPPVSQRKRVAAPFGNGDQKHFQLTPMPLRSGGSSVAGAGMFNGKGHGKHRREGPCVGTKGFRAPEVLFRSFHQGCKVDVWSAGVTLLYFIIGKSPFGGDPEQNIKEIAKLKGSEELWEVAKLHNCESSYPSDLFDVKSLESVDLKEWCASNTRRPDLLKLIPDSLFDLVDKCLAVNPRCRITSQDALLHEFFAPCRENLRRQQRSAMLRRSKSNASNPPPLCLPQSTMVKAKES